MDRSGPGHGLAGGILRLIFPLDDRFPGPIMSFLPDVAARMKPGNSFIFRLPILVFKTEQSTTVICSVLKNSA